MAARVLLLGGIGSGKSTAAAWFAERGATVLSSDDYARDVLRPGTTATRAVLAIWPAVGDEDGIDRAALGRVVFADEAELAALEAIVHPATRDALRSAVESHPHDDVVVELPILRGWFQEGWLRVVVDAPDETRVQRSVARGAMTADDVRRVMERQPRRAEWLLAADFVIDNRGTVDQLHGQCAAVWDRVH